MFFQISPVRKSVKKVSKPNVSNVSEEITELSLAPFTGNPKLSFDDVAVKSISNRKLLVKNPHNYDVQLNISHSIPDDMNVTFNWRHHELKANTETTLEIVWCPQCEGNWRYNLTIEGSRKIQRVVPIAFKSVSSKVKKKQNTRPPKVGYFSRRVSPAKKSPTQKKKATTTLLVPPKYTNDVPRIKISTPENSNYRKANKENITNVQNTSTFVSPSNASFHFEMTKTVERRDTYTVRTEYIPSNILTSSTLHNISSELKKDEQNSYVDHNRDYVSDYSFNDSLEMPPLGRFDEKIVRNKTDCINTPVFSGNLLSRLQSDSFTISPVSVPKPSMNHLNLNSNTNYSTLLNRPDNRDVTHNLSSHLEAANRNVTYDMDQCSSKPCNLSTETYIKGNLSSETYTKADISTGTYIKDGSLTDFTALSVSPLSSKHPSNNTRNMQESNYHFFLDKNRSSPVYESKQKMTSPKYKEAHFDKPFAHLSPEMESNWHNFQSNKLGSIVEESFAGVENKNRNSAKKTLKRPSSHNLSSVSPKRLNIESPRNKSKSCSWSKKPVSFNTSKKTSGLNLQHIQRPDCDADKETHITVTNTHQVTITNPFILAATTMIDPFMTLGIYVDQAWVEEQERNFKKWLNALLTPPEELNSDIEGPAVSVAKLWQQCKNRDVAEAPTKEAVSQNYHTNARLNSLRKSARALYMSGEISNVLSKVVSTVETEKLMVRKDRNIHLDLGLQADTMSLLLSYNPLWLRIGLETIYNQQIPLNSNSDVIGLNTFIMTRFFRDPHLLKKHKSIHAPKYVQDVKKHILKKFFILVYFLDQAKTKKLIAHDPCLFCKNAPVKESRELLIRFARDTISSIGDITKYLKLFGYIVVHKQTYINEFDYAVKNLGSDLRDGVRLTRVMEIILLEESLTDKLRVPAISRLQKVYNTKLAFDALEKAGYQILQDISPKDLVDGHREKTLSFLWQIIYKFEAPLMVKSVTTIQGWWRSLGVALKRNKLRRIRVRRETAAEKIQQWFRNQKMSRKLEEICKWVTTYIYNRRRELAAVKIQAYFRMYIQQKKYFHLKSTTIRLQAHARRWLLNNHYKQRILAAIKIQSFIRMYLARTGFIKLKHATLTIQSYYIAYKLMELEQSRYKTLKYTVLFVEKLYTANKLMKLERGNYLSKKQAALTVQRRYRANKLMQQQLKSYTTIKCAALTIQSWYRSVKLMQQCKLHYHTLKRSVQTIEQKYLAKKLMQQHSERYQTIKQSTLIIQQRYVAYKKMNLQRNYFLRLKRAAVVIQTRYRANKEFEIRRKSYLELRKHVIICQNRFRANRAMKIAMRDYQTLRKAAIVIQTRYRATQMMKKEYERFKSLRISSVKIQRYYRAWIAMKTQRNVYCQLKTTTMRMQTLFRAKLSMKKARGSYIEMKSAAIVIQRHFKAHYLMINQCKQFTILKNAAICIQRRYRAKMQMKLHHSKFIQLKTATIVLQQHFRANALMKEQKEKYILLRSATLLLQRRYRAKRSMERDMSHYTKLKSAAILIQRRFRAQRAMLSTLSEYQTLKATVSKMQILYRAKVQMKLQRAAYTKLKRAAISIQQRYRAVCLMKIDMYHYKSLRDAAIVVQRRFRAQRSMLSTRSKYRTLRATVLKMQILYRAKVEMKLQKAAYTELRQAAISIQQKYRAVRLMKIDRYYYKSLRNAAIVVQRRFRAQRSMWISLCEYQSLKRAVTMVQRLYRAKIIMRLERVAYSKLRAAAVTIQTRYRAMLEMKANKERYNNLKNAAIVFQRRYRAQRSRRLAYNEYHSLKNAVLRMQKLYRAKVKMQQMKSSYDKLKQSTIFVQRRFRAIYLMRTEMYTYMKLRNATIIIQRRYRARKLMQIHSDKYHALRNNVIRIQMRYRAKLQMRLEMNAYTQLKYHAVAIQRRFRANRLTKKHRTEYQQLRQATVAIQRRFRETLLARQQMIMYTKLRNAAVFVQRKYRAKLLMKLERQRYLSITKAVYTLQQRFRAFITRRRVMVYYQKLRAATVFVQREYRAKLLMKETYNNYMSLKNTTLKIQQRFRAKRQMKRDLEAYQKLRLCTIMVQRKFRSKQMMLKDRETFISYKRSISVIEQRFIEYKHTIRIRREFLKMKNAAMQIQNFYRNFVIMKSQRQQFLLLRKSCVLIQQQYRAIKMMQICRQEYLELKEKSIFIQRWWRSVTYTRKVQRNFIIIKQSTIIIQKFYRQYRLCKRDSNYYKKLKHYVTLIQRRYRAMCLMRKNRQQYLLLRNSAVIIQRYFRNYSVMKLERARFIKTKNIILNIQPHLRGYLIRKKYSQALSAEAKQERREKRTKSKAATKIQALWRGHKSRSLEDPKLVQIRQRTKEACSKALPEDTLGHRCKQAVQLLITDNVTLLQILKVLQDLEYITRRCRDSCIQLSRTFPEQLYLIIGSTSRSLPEMNACDLATHILINFCKYHKTAAYSWVPEYMDNIVTVMLHWCDKESLLFSSLCTLLWLFAHNEEYKSVIKSIPNYSQRMTKIETLCMRKHKMVNRTGIKGSSVFGPYRNLPLPSLKPDWGLDLRNKPKTFTNSVHALHNLLLLLR